MQDRTPAVADASMHGLKPYFGDYPYKLLMSLRKHPKGQTLQALAHAVGALATDVHEVQDALDGLVEDLGIVEKKEKEGQETVWRVAP